MARDGHSTPLRTIGFVAPNSAAITKPEQCFRAGMPRPRVPLRVLELPKQHSSDRSPVGDRAAACDRVLDRELSDPTRRRRHLGGESAGAGAVRCPGWAGQVRMRVIGGRVGGMPSLVSGCCAFPASDSSTMVWLRARHRGQYVIASQEALGATVSRQRGQRRTDRSPRAADARRSVMPASRIAAARYGARGGVPMGSGPHPLGLTGV